MVSGHGGLGISIVVDVESLLVGHHSSLLFEDRHRVKSPGPCGRNLHVQV